MDHFVLKKLKLAKIDHKVLSFILIITVLFFAIVFYSTLTNTFGQKKSIKIGILFSTTGSMADIERPSLRASLLAIEELNQQGGINGALIEPIVYDPASNLNKTAQLATKLIVEDKVVAIFGCHTSSSRKKVKEVVEKYDSLLIYPVDYEGVEESKNIIYLDMTPNQKIIPAVSWIAEQKVKKMYLAGSNYIWPRVTNEIITHEIQQQGGEVVGSSYLILGSTDVAPIVDDIIAKKPDVVISTMVGRSALAFLQRLYDKIPAMQLPIVMVLDVIPVEENGKKQNEFLGLYLVVSYFKELVNPENKAFLKAYENKYGSSKEVDYPAATSYAGVYLLAQAIRQSPQLNPLSIRENMLRQSIASPAGVMYIDPVNANTWRSVFINRINQQGISELVWTSNVPIEPNAYPDFKTKAEWDFFEYQLFVGWGNAWEKTDN
jgi:urea transport system substrate-binding protein